MISTMIPYKGVVLVREKGKSPNSLKREGEINYYVREKGD